jgi:hypothetical protein
MLGLSGLTGCGWFDDKAPPSNEFYESSNAAELCEIDPDEISLILEKDISKQLWCIQANLDEFSRNVKINNQSEIKQDELNKFVSSLFGAEASGYIDGIVILFQVNTILIQDKNNKIGVKDLRRLFESLVVLNKLAVKLNLVFRGVTPDNFYKKRQELVRITRELTRNLAKVIGGGGRMDCSIDLYEFMDMLNTKLNDNKSTKFSTLQKIRSFFRIKTLMVGGERNILTAKEFRSLLPKFHILAGVIFDLIGRPADMFKTKAESYGHINNIMIKTEEIFHDVKDLDKSVLSLSELKDIAAEIGLGEKYGKYEKLIADFHHHVLGAESDEISHRHIRTTVVLFQFLFPLIETYYSINPLPRDLKEQDIAVRKGILEQLQIGLEEWKLEVDVLKDHPFFPKQVDLKSFLLALNDSPLGDEWDVQAVLDTMLLKKVFIGGDLDSWSKEDLIELNQKAPELASVAYTTVYLQDIFGHETSDKYRLLKENMQTLKRLLFTKDKFASMLDFDEFLTFIDTFQDKVKTLDFLPSVKALWPRIFKHEKAEVLVGDAAYILEQVADVMQELEFNHKTMELHPSLMHEKDTIKYIHFKRDNYYRNLGQANFHFLHHRLAKLLDKHRYFHNSKSYAIFDYDITRTSTGLTLFTSLRFVFEVLMEAYGNVTSRNPIQIVMDRTQVNTLLNDLKSVMEPFGLWTTKIKTFARNTLLMADLFQDVSNGNMKLDLVEMIDYGSMVLSALTMTNHTLENFTIACPNVGTKEKPAYEVGCYRPNFFKTILNDFGFKRYLPNLAKYLDSVDKTEALEFLVSTEKFARDIPDDSVPMAKRDFALLLGSLLSIESVFLKYDVNRNNIIDEDELEEAFKLFEDALIELAKLKDGKEKYARSIFMYLVKYQELPDGSWDVGWFHYITTNNPFGSDIIAKRFHIGIILYTLTKKAPPE